MEHLYKKLNKVFSDKITSAGSLHFFAFQLSHCQFARIFFHLKLDCRIYIIFSEITRTQPIPPPLPPIKSRMVGHLVRHSRKLLGSFFGWEVSSAFKQTKIKEVDDFEFRSMQTLRKIRRFFFRVASYVSWTWLSYGFVCCENVVWNVWEVTFPPPSW